MYGVAVSTIAIEVSFVQKRRRNIVLNSGLVAFFSVVIKEVLLTVYYRNWRVTQLIPNRAYCFKRYMRMDEATYDNLFKLIEP